MFSFHVTLPFVGEGNHARKAVNIESLREARAAFLVPALTPRFSPVVSYPGFRVGTNAHAQT